MSYNSDGKLSLPQVRPCISGALSSVWESAVLTILDRRDGPEPLCSKGVRTRGRESFGSPPATIRHPFAYVYQRLGHAVIRLRGMGGAVRRAVSTYSCRRRRGREKREVAAWRVMPSSSPMSAQVTPTSRIMCTTSNSRMRRVSRMVSISARTRTKAGGGSSFTPPSMRDRTISPAQAECFGSDHERC